jgi:chromosome segregation ATPase
VSKNMITVTGLGMNARVALTDSEQMQLSREREDLSKSLDDMIAAIQGNRAVQDMAQNLGEKGFWSSLPRVISGANDKDLAGMVKALGGSLETTQKVVEVMLRLQTRKSLFLREFHSALLNKIEKIHSDTKTLDSNQYVALDVMVTLRDHVADQLQQFETVERHEYRIGELVERADRAGLAEQELREGAAALDNQVANLKRAEAHLSGEVEEAHRELISLSTELKALDAKGNEQVQAIEQRVVELKRAGTHLSQEVEEVHRELVPLSAELKALDAKGNERIQVIEQRFAELFAKRDKDLASSAASREEFHSATQQVRLDLQLSIESLSTKLDQALEREDALANMIGTLEARWSGMSTWRGRLRQQWVGLVSLLAALVALAHTFRG